LNNTLLINFPDLIAVSTSSPEIDLFLLPPIAKNANDKKPNNTFNALLEKMNPTIKSESAKDANFNICNLEYGGYKNS
jgi:hypothetical protein